MMHGLLTATGKSIRLFKRLMAVVVLVAFIALSFNCFACDSVSDPLTGKGYLQHSEKPQHHSDADHCRQHDDHSSDCCSTLMSMLSNSSKSIQKAAAPLPSSTHIVAIIPVSTAAFAAVETFLGYDPPDELSPAFLFTSFLSLRAPPISA